MTAGCELDTPHPPLGTVGRRDRCGVTQRELSRRAIQRRHLRPGPTWTPHSMRQAHKLSVPSTPAVSVAAPPAPQRSVAQSWASVALACPAQVGLRPEACPTSHAPVMRLSHPTWPAPCWWNSVDDVCSAETTRGGLVVREVARGLLIPSTSWWHPDRAPPGSRQGTCLVRMRGQGSPTASGAASWGLRLAAWLQSGRPARKAAGPCGFLVSRRYAATSAVGCAVTCWPGSPWPRTSSLR